MGGERQLRRGSKLLGSLLLVFCLCESYFNILDKIIVQGFPLQKEGYILLEGDDTTLLPGPDASPSRAPQPYIPLLAPSPLGPFSNNIIPKLSGLCKLNFSAAESMMRTTAVDCYQVFAPFLANVICCPQLHATLVILVGQSSKETGLLALDATHANHCLSDIQKILISQGANTSLADICSVHPLNLTEGTCPVNDVNGVESVVDSSKLLAACRKVDPVNECCSQICQNAILEAARKIALRDGGLPSADGARMLPEHLSKIDDCKNIILRWLASRLDPSSAKQVLRRISNCNINRVCPLVFPDAKTVARDCVDVIENRTACCSTVNNYVSHLQKQSFITNLQALDCAATFGLQLQQMNISTNVYSLCHTTLKDFSLQVGIQESGCLLPSLPSDATFDQSSGVSFTCDLNDNIAAPWPSTSQSSSSSSCNMALHFSIIIVLILQQVYYTAGPSCCNISTSWQTCRSQTVSTCPSISDPWVVSVTHCVRVRGHTFTVSHPWQPVTSPVRSVLEPYSEGSVLLDLFISQWLLSSRVSYQLNYAFHVAQVDFSSP